MIKLAVTLLSVATTLNANPLPAAPQPQNNFHPNLAIGPNIKMDHKMDTQANQQETDYNWPAWPYEDKQKGHGPEMANPDGLGPQISQDDDGEDQNKMMNEISNIIQQNNQNIRNIKHPGNNLPETPVLNDVREPNERPVAERDPNNPEEFEHLPRINERIPVVNREIMKEPNVRRRIPIANEEVYNAPKVHDRVPSAKLGEPNQLKLNDLEDVDNVANVIDKLDAHMKANGEFQMRHIPKPVHETDHRIFQGSIDSNYRPDLSDTIHPCLIEDRAGNVGAAGAKREKAMEGDRIQNHGNLIHEDHHHHHSHRGADMGEIPGQSRINRKQIHQNGLRRLQQNYPRRTGNLKRKLLRRQQFGRNLGRGAPKGLEGLKTLHESRRKAFHQPQHQPHLGDTHGPREITNNLDIVNQIRALEEEVSPKHNSLKHIIQVAPQQINLADLENVDNVNDVISALDAELKAPVQLEKDLGLKAPAQSDKNLGVVFHGSGQGRGGSRQNLAQSALNAELKTPVEAEKGLGLKTPVQTAKDLNGGFGLHGRQRRGQSRQKLAQSPGKEKVMSSQELRHPGVANQFENGRHRKILW